MDQSEIYVAFTKCIE